jgi:hypothetical protein
MSKWQKEVFIMPADLQSESELIHSHTAPKRALCGADVQHRTLDAKLPAKPLFGASMGLWGGASRTT